MCDVQTRLGHVCTLSVKWLVSMYSVSHSKSILVCDGSMTVLICPFHICTSNSMIPTVHMCLVLGHVKRARCPMTFRHVIHCAEVRMFTL